MSHVKTPWTHLASCVARGLLSRKGVKFQELTRRFETLQIRETARGIDGKIARGTYSFSFLLQLLRALRSECPDQWRPIISLELSYDELAKHIFVQELSIHGMDVQGFVKRLSGTGTHLSLEEVQGQVDSGMFQFVLVLQLASVARIEGIERFVDACDVSEAAVKAARVDVSHKTLKR